MSASINLKDSLTVLTNVRVLVGLLFLIIEIRQNNEFLEFEKESRSISELVETAALLSRDESLTSALLKETSARTPEEIWRLSAAVRSNLNAIERAWSQGYFQASAGLTMRYRLAFNADDPRGVLLREIWVSQKIFYEESFIEWFENNIANET